MLSRTMCFQRYCDIWLQQYRLHLQRLLSAPRPETRGLPENQHPQHQLQLQALVDQALAHYENYYRAKALAARHNVLFVYSPAWVPTIELALHWIGGWRPTAAFHLIYTESGIRFEAQLPHLLRGYGSGDLGDLSPSQLARVSDLQCETVCEENAISEEMAGLQDSVGDLFSDLDAKIKGLERVLAKADDLRMKTIRRIVAILCPLQAVDFLIAAAQLQLGFRGWGMARDRKRGTMWA